MKRANALKVGLGGYVFTRSLKRAHEASEAMETGMVGVTPWRWLGRNAVRRHQGERLRPRRRLARIKDYLDVKYTNMVLM